jgi:diacylglycerol kinase
MFRRSRAAAFRIALRLLADGKSTNGVPGKNRTFMTSLKRALRGLLYTFINERNFRFEWAAAILAVAAGFFFRISRLEWALLSVNIFFVLALEVKNTSTELTTDIATQEYHYGAKSSKDASSGAVLLAALSSVVTGLLIFGPRIVLFVRNIVSFLHNQ